MNRKNMPGWLIVPVFLGLGVVFFFIGYWPDHSALEGALGVLAAICWFLIELAVHPYESRYEKESNNKFGLL